MRIRFTAAGLFAVAGLGLRERLYTDKVLRLGKYRNGGYRLLLAAGTFLVDNVGFRYTRMAGGGLISGSVDQRTRVIWDFACDDDGRWRSCTVHQAPFFGRQHSPDGRGPSATGRKGTVSFGSCRANFPGERKPGHASAVRVAGLES